ncbi:MAG TPA: fasciclin domain-containing protein [Planctomycetota bacterium]|nr:fasciclin domain-containing protein [Planctomycetota bacterium]
MRKVWLVVVLAGLLVVPLAGCKSEPAGAAPEGKGKDIIQTATDAGNFTKFLDAVKSAGLTDTLRGKGPYTVFAPTDEAFGKMPAGTLDDLMKPENSKKLAEILKYHVVNGRLSAERASRTKELDTLSGQRLTVKVEEGGKITVDGATITKPDIVCSNGIIQQIDAVMMPPDVEKHKTADPAAEVQRKDIVETARETGNHNTFGKALKEAGLLDTLKGAGPFTVFAPTDQAFEKLPAGTLDNLMKPENKDQLAHILKYHVVQQKVMSDRLGRMRNLSTLAGQELKVTSEKGKVMVDGANVTQPDIICSNGVIHSIDAVMLPPVEEEAE